MWQDEQWPASALSLLQIRPIHLPRWQIELRRLLLGVVATDVEFYLSGRGFPFLGVCSGWEWTRLRLSLGPRPMALGTI
jgi:hypothetical protein